MSDNDIRNIENHEIKGLTIRTMVITLGCCLSMCVTVLTTYFGLKSDIKDVAQTQETTNRVNEIRLKTLEAEVSLLQAEVHEIREK